MKKLFLLIFVVCLTVGCREELKVETHMDDPDIQRVKRMYAARKDLPKTEKEKLEEAKLAASKEDDSRSESDSTDEKASEVEVAEAIQEDARVVLKQAIADAKTQDKRLFVHFTADW